MNESTLAERAMTTLVDYLCLLREKAGAEDEAEIAIRNSQTPEVRKHGRLSVQRKLVLESREADRWFCSKMEAWARAGRLGPDGALKTGPGPQRWRPEMVEAAFPLLGKLDQVAVLIDLDGVLPGGWMEGDLNIRAVVEEIVDVKVARLFSRIMSEIRRAGGGQPECIRATSIMRPSDGGPGGARRKRRKDPATGEILEPAEWDARQQKIMLAKQDEPGGR